MCDRAGVAGTGCGQFPHLTADDPDQGVAEAASQGSSGQAKTCDLFGRSPQSDRSVDGGKCRERGCQGGVDKVYCKYACGGQGTAGGHRDRRPAADRAGAADYQEYISEDRAPDNRDG